MAFLVARFALALAALVPTGESSWSFKTSGMEVDFHSKVALKVWETGTGALFLGGNCSIFQEPQFNGRLHVTALADNKKDFGELISLGVAIKSGVLSVRAAWLWAVAIATTSFGVWRGLSGWQPLHRQLQLVRTIIYGQHRRQHVVVHVVGGGKTKMLQCDAQRTVGAMREEMGVPLDAVILLVPGGGELEDEMRVGEIVGEGLMTVEVRCRGVGGGKAEDGDATGCR